MNYYIADTHFGHANIIAFDERPFSGVSDMEETIVRNWNSTVGRGDTVYILGDFCWNKEDEWLRLLGLLNGQKVLVLGNHDLRNMSKTLKSKFAKICDYEEVTDCGKHIIMSHYPILFYKGSYNPNIYMLHGHVHSLTKESQILREYVKNLRDRYVGVPDNYGNIINVGCMMDYMDYTPRTIDYITEWGCVK